MIHYYIWDRESKQVRPAGLLEWGAWFETAHHFLANDEAAEGVRVSTVFLGIDRSFGRGGPPLLWETVVLAPSIPDLDRSRWRYATQGEAEAGHAEALRQVREALGAAS